MFCENPRGMYPCGKCRACRLRKANEKMIISIFAAHEYATKGQFLTLTYNDAHKPDGLKHSDFAGFMKRLRELDGTPDVKYFMAGEYGGDEECTHREHFHVLFYNHRYDMKLVEQAWSEPYTHESFGFSYDGTLTPQSMKYVSGYVDKKGYDPQSGKRPPYGRSSVNIPDGLTPAELVRCCRNGTVQYNGRTFLFPVKWRKRYKEIWDFFKEEREGRKITGYEHRAVYAPWLGEYIEWDSPIEKKHGANWTPEQVRAMMDERDIKMSLKKKKKKRIMYQ